MHLRAPGDSSHIIAQFDWFVQRSLAMVICCHRFENCAPILQPAGVSENDQSTTSASSPADLTAATGNLAKLLGKRKRSLNKPGYDGLEN
jgi:hypothetical protein